LRGALFPASRDAALSERIRGEQVRAVLRVAPFTLLANVGNGAAVVGVSWGEIPPAALIAWAFCVLVLGVIPMRAWLAMHKKHERHGTSPRSIIRLTRNTAILGLLWIIPIVWFFHALDTPRQLVLACVIVGMMCGGAFALTTVPPAAGAFVGILAAAAFVSLVATGDPIYGALAALFVIYGVVLVGGVVWNARVFIGRLLSEAAGERQSQVIGLLLWETDSAGCLQHISARFGQIVGRPLDSLRGADLVDVLGAIDPGNTGLHALRRRMNVHATFRDLVIPIVINGEKRFWSLTGKPIFGANGGYLGYRGVGRDVTAARSSEEELKHARKFLNTVIDNIPATILVKDAREQRFVLINRAGEDLLGVSRLDLLGKRAGEVYQLEQAEKLAADDAEALRSPNGIVITEQTLSTPHNGVRTVTSQKLAIVGDRGEPDYVLAVVEDITEKKRTEARIDHLVRHDPPTDLPNRVFFNERLARTLEHAEFSRAEFAVLCIDLDRFNEVNDVFGHAIGDAVLCELARRLRVAAGDAFFARIGGDEFALILKKGDQPSAATEAAARLLDAVADDIVVENYRAKVGLSVGVALYPRDGRDAAVLLANADAALHRAKAEGRGSIRFFDPNMEARLRERRALQNELRAAIQHNQLELHYQPQARMTREIIGFEVLTRWHHPTLGLVPPNIFIPLAEESGLIVPIGEWILREACREAATWPRPLQIAVNLSPVQFRSGDLPGLVHTILLETGLAPGRLELEITEGVLIEDFSHVSALLRQIKALGVRVAMDDFGTGYSSLSYLHSFPFDKLKIDRSFIANVARRDQAATIVRAVLELASRLGIPVAAEGVETEAQFAFLAGEACAEVQGYLIGRPRPIAYYAALTGRPAAAARGAAVN
jgi:diguanylate cyclase (GGDEF)-like protein/PAS domain S-box-containing protein